MDMLFRFYVNIYFEFCMKFFVFIFVLSFVNGNEGGYIKVGGFYGFLFDGFSFLFFRVEFNISGEIVVDMYKGLFDLFLRNNGYF